MSDFPDDTPFPGDGPPPARSGIAARHLTGSSQGARSITCHTWQKTSCPVSGEPIRGASQAVRQLREKHDGRQDNHHRLAEKPESSEDQAGLGAKPSAEEAPSRARSGGPP
jgi:hypothetical protein